MNIFKKIRVVVLLCFCSFCPNSFYGQSKIIESLSVDSELLNTKINYSIYLPDGYESSQRSYPIVYLLNGFSGDELDWIHFGNIQFILDKAIKKGKIVDLIVVMPDGDDRLYLNRPDGTYPYEKMFIKEFIPDIEKKYRVRKEKRFRAISGVSMGGAGALRFALKHSNIFGTCVAFSPGILTDEELITLDQGFYDNYFGRISLDIIGLKGKERLSTEYRAYDLIDLVKNIDPVALNNINIYYDCGDDDFLSSGNAQLHIELKKKDILHEYRVNNGAHTWYYWRDRLTEGLEFIGTSIIK